jgi:hypothetical protein
MLRDGSTLSAFRPRGTSTVFIYVYICKQNGQRILKCHTVNSGQNLRISKMQLANCYLYLPISILITEEKKLDSLISVGWLVKR